MIVVGVAVAQSGRVVSVSGVVRRVGGNNGPGRRHSGTESQISLLLGGGSALEGPFVLDAALLVLNNVREEECMQVALVPLEFAFALPSFATRVDVIGLAGDVTKTL